MPTIKDVAGKAGVSVATVSRVINQRGYLSEATKAAVHKAMKELDYYPNDLAHPLSLIYHTMGPRWVKHLLENAIRLVMPGRLVAHDGPSTTIVTLNRQPAENRLVLHLMHYVPERRTQKYDIVEDVIPLHDVGISLLVGTKPQRVFLVPQMEPIAFRFTSGTIQFTVPRVDGHQMVEITV